MQYFDDDYYCTCECDSCGSYDYGCTCECDYCGCNNDERSFITSNKYLTRASLGIKFQGDLIVPASVFVDDNGDRITSFVKDFDYYNLYINGMIQLNGVASVSPAQIVIFGGDALDLDNPILIEFVTLNRSR